MRIKGLLCLSVYVCVLLCVCVCVCVCVCTDLPLSPGTAAIHIILAEHTAMQASTVGSSLMFNKHTWREKTAITSAQLFAKFKLRFFFLPQIAREIKSSPLSLSLLLRKETDFLTCPTYPSLLHTHTSQPLSGQLWLGEAHENWRQITTWAEKTLVHLLKWLLYRY